MTRVSASIPVDSFKKVKIMETNLVRFTHPIIGKVDAFKGKRMSVSGIPFHLRGWRSKSFSSFFRDEYQRLKGQGLLGWAPPL